MSKDDFIDTLLSAHMDSILDTLGDGVYITDRDGVTLKVNTMYEKLTGLKREDILGRNVRELKKSGVYNTALNPEIVATGKPVTRVQTNMHDRRMVLSGYPIFDEEGAVTLVVTYARDITMMSQMKDQIAEQRELIEKYHKNFDYFNKAKTQQTPIVVTSAVMTRLVEQIQRIAPTDATVLLLGETGVGKDVVARKMHGLSSRHDRPFFKVDCASIPENLIESELFGYVPGAFSGALTKGKIGFFELADKGTIFLDEIGELPQIMQSKLLRVLQDQEVVRVGSTQAKKVDVRIVAATNRDLAEEVRKGTFRSDLYYRLRVAVLNIPPLRDRPEDILPLTRTFLERFTARYRKRLVLSHAVEEAMKNYRWPGNVRELENMIQSLVITCEKDVVELGDLPGAMLDDQKPTVLAASLACHIDNAAGRPLKEIMAEIERGLIRDALEAHGSVTKVARMFGVNRTTIFRKLHMNDEQPG
ncbi:sigma-54 interaction domain-containing protein [Fundidesulfovibrio soli]|uniref:sigma-54 interaction domain-containing protein n=1 Tax=Fundidesulfovibrio soli TaxID=2922716 RepID=UPI001FAEEB73|nr:sigma 54-interacting transcriptional regulator [Fundidesulfovibrio soli]